MTTGKIRILCKQCGAAFSAPHVKVRAGQSISCDSCACTITFDSESGDPDIRQALASARRYRLSLSSLLS